MNTRTTLTALAACALAALAGCRTVPPPVYSVTQKARAPEAASLASSVAADVRGKLLDRGYPVLAEGARPAPRTPVVRIDFGVERAETAKLDVWHIYEGRLDARIFDGAGALRAEKSFSAAGGRSDTEAGAEAGVRTGLSNGLNAWLADVLPRVQPRESAR